MGIGGFHHQRFCLVSTGTQLAPGLFEPWIARFVRFKLQRRKWTFVVYGCGLRWLEAVLKYSIVVTRTLLPILAISFFDTIYISQHLLTSFAIYIALVASYHSHLAAVTRFQYTRRHLDLLSRRCDCQIVMIYFSLETPPLSQRLQP